MGSATVYLDDDISVCDVNDYSLQSGDVTVEISADGWWRLIESLQDWLGECPHCGRLVGAAPTPPSESPPLGAVGEADAARLARAEQNQPPSGKD